MLPCKKRNTCHPYHKFYEQDQLTFLCKIIIILIKIKINILNQIWWFKKTQEQRAASTRNIYSSYWALCSHYRIYKLSSHIHVRDQIMIWVDARAHRTPQDQVRQFLILKNEFSVFILQWKSIMLNSWP